MARGRQQPASDDDEAFAGLDAPGPDMPAPADTQPAALSIDDAQLANANAREREWNRKVNTDLAKHAAEVEAKHLALLVDEFGEDAAQRMMRAIAPILLAGREYGRRERYRPPIKAA